MDVPDGHFVGVIRARCSGTCVPDSDPVELGDVATPRAATSPSIATPATPTTALGAPQEESTDWRAPNSTTSGSSPTATSTHHQPKVSASHQRSLIYHARRTRTITLLGDADRSGRRSGACTSGYRPGRSGGSRPDGPARKAGWLRTLTDAAITTLLNRVQTMPSSFSGIGLQHMGGAAARIAPMGTAFAHRAEQYDVLILSRWADPAESSGTSPGPERCSRRWSPT